MRDVPAEQIADDGADQEECRHRAEEVGPLAAGAMVRQERRLRGQGNGAAGPGQRPADEQQERRGEHHLAEGAAADAHAAPDERPLRAPAVGEETGGQRGKPGGGRRYGEQLTQERGVEAERLDVEVEDDPRDADGEAAEKGHPEVEPSVARKAAEGVKIRP